MSEHSDHCRENLLGCVCQPSDIEREVMARPRWRVYWKDASFPCLTIPATSDGEARRLALLMGPASGIRKVERVSTEEK